MQKSDVSWAIGPRTARKIGSSICYTTLNWLSWVFGVKCIQCYRLRIYEMDFNLDKLLNFPNATVESCSIIALMISTIFKFAGLMKKYNLWRNYHKNTSRTSKFN